MILSIIIPVYNVEDYIQECIVSILKQNIEYLEIIVVNDGSTDRSLDILLGFRDEKIKIINQQNGGLSSARNTGLKNAKGDYIMFLDSDDFLEKNLLKQIINEIDNDIDILVANFKWYYEKNSLKNRVEKITNFKTNMSGSEYYKKTLKNKTYAPVVWKNVYKRSFLIDNKIEFENGIYHEDELFTPIVLKEAKNLKVRNIPFYIYRQREGSIMNSERNMKKYNDILLISEKLNMLDFNDKNLNKLKNSYILELLMNYMILCKIEEIPQIFNLVNKKRSSIKTKVKAILFKKNIRIYCKLREVYNGKK